MAGGGRTYYATGTGRFSTGKEIRTDAAGLKTATRKGELRVLSSFGTTQENPKGSMSKEELLDVLRSGDTIKFGDGSSVKINAGNKVAVANRLVSEGQRQLTPAPANTGPKIGGSRGLPTPVAKPAQPAQPAKPASKPVQTAKPVPRGQPKPASKPATKPTPRVAGGRRNQPRLGRGMPAVAKPSSSGPKRGLGGLINRGVAKPAKGGKDGGKATKGGGSKRDEAKGFISAAGIVQIGNRRKGGGGKKDRKARKARPRRKGGRSNKGRSK